MDLLYETTVSGDVESLVKLLDTDAKKYINTRYPNIIGKTPLISACYQGHYEIVQVLLAHGADINATDNFLNTGLHFAMANGYRDIINVLLAHGASVDRVNINGWTPLD